MGNHQFLKKERRSMSPLTREIFEEAKRQARKMIESDEVIRRIQFGHEGGGCFWVSRDSKRVIGGEEIAVDGQDFFVGFAPTEEEK